MSESINVYSSSTELLKRTAEECSRVSQSASKVLVSSQPVLQPTLNKSEAELNALTKRADIIPTLNKPAAPLTSLESLGNIMSTVKTMQSQYANLLDACSSLYNNTMKAYVSDLLEQFDAFVDEIIEKQNEIKTKQEALKKLNEELSALKQKLAGISEDDPEWQELSNRIVMVEKEQCALQKDIDELTCDMVELEIQFVAQDEILSKLDKIISQLVTASNAQNNADTTSSNELFNNIICNFMKFILSSANEMQKTLREIADKRAQSEMDKAQQAARDASEAAAKSQRRSKNFSTGSKIFGVLAAIVGTVLAIVTAVALPTVGAIGIAVVSTIAACVTVADAICYAVMDGEETPFDKIWSSLSNGTIDLLKKITEKWLPTVVRFFGGNEKDCENWVEGVSLTAYVIIMIHVMVGCAVAMGGGTGSGILGQFVGTAKELTVGTLKTIEVMRGMTFAASLLGGGLGAGLSIGLSVEQESTDRLLAIAEELNAMMDRAFSIAQDAMSQMGMVTFDDQIDNLRAAVEIMLTANRKLVEA
ncbi:hypothetical protein DYT72_23130 [Escherichia coli]|nr:hypothetical protein [Escherichia coli]EFE6858368.1 hypothetical protein [Escherichia coli]EFO0740856.1 hypothetical protein [Escherichia coli]EHB0476289.1 hypothetical protein [Escherichia coli]